METPPTRPDTVNRLIFAADAAFAMLAGMQLDLFTPLKGRSMTAEDIAQAIGVSPARLRLLLYALVAAGLLSEKDGHFSNTPESERLLVKDSPSYMGDIHRLLSYRWVSNLPKTAESLRSGVPQAKVDFSSSSEQEVEAFLRRINALTVVAARALLDRYDFSSCKTLADVGCGGAGLALAIAQACPHIQVTAIDLPLVTPIAQRIVEEQRAADRVKVIAADVLSGPLTGSYEVMIARALLQVLPSDQAKLAVKNIGAAIKPGGKIYILAQILDDSRTSPLEAVGYNLRFINTFDAGESYTQQEHRDWLTAAGFVNIERANFLLPDEHGLITARKHAG
jgi:2-polyprenyl-3-methyl-5-hydroxy-6-metoxy-1,4-benzoquinol methylase